MIQLALKVSVGLVLICARAHSAGGQILLLHEFAGAPGDGNAPSSALALSGSTLYGTTVEGGLNSDGSIFKINTDGAAYSVLYNFVGGTDGRKPYGAPVLVGSTLYGTTNTGGPNGGGTLFKVNTDGSSFAVLHAFGGDYDGRSPFGALSVSGSTLFGTTYAGGDFGVGTVFKIDTNGSGYSLMHSFVPNGVDGHSPYSGLTLVGPDLFGTTRGGGSNGSGTVYTIGATAAAYDVLHDFAGGTGDGSNPFSSLTPNGSTLYGTSRLGGANNGGTLFRIETNGNGFGLVHSFAGGFDDGLDPFAAPTLDGSILYGTTSSGDSNVGAIYKVNTDGSGFSLLHDFVGGLDDGRRAESGLILIGSSLYGTTVNGGESTLGTVYAFSLIGDYNHNGAVDAADYVLWRHTLGSTTDLRANGDNTGASAGVIDTADHTFWRAHFGQPAGSGSGVSVSAVVPEPASLAFLMLSAAAFCPLRCRGATPVSKLVNA